MPHYLSSLTAPHGSDGKTGIRGEKGLTEPYKQSRGSHLTVSLPLGKNSVTTHLNDCNNDDDHDGISECRIDQGL